jgi:hypothetical protein
MTTTLIHRHERDRIEFTYLCFDFEEGKDLVARELLELIGPNNEDTWEYMLWFSNSVESSAPFEVKAFARRHPTKNLDDS